MTTSGPTGVDLGFTLIPPDDLGVTSADDLDAAEQAALDTPVTPEPEEPREPFGMSWVFDFERGRFVRNGSDAAQTRGAGALGQWCLMALHSARYAHAVFDDEFGFEEPDDVLGGTTVLFDDWSLRARDALLVHDRIVDVQLDGAYDPTSGVLTLTTFVVTTDEDEQLDMGELSMPIATETGTYGE